MFCSCSISDNAPQEEGYTIEVVKPANITELGGGSSLVMQCTSMRIHLRGKETMLAYHVQHVLLGSIPLHSISRRNGPCSSSQGNGDRGRSRSPALMSVGPRQHALKSRCGWCSKDGNDVTVSRDQPRRPRWPREQQPLPSWRSRVSRTSWRSRQYQPLRSSSTNEKHFQGYWIWENSQFLRSGAPSMQAFFWIVQACNWTVDIPCRWAAGSNSGVIPSFVERGYV
jgi:hypothetical protein